MFKHDFNYINTINDLFNLMAQHNAGNEKLANVQGHNTGQQT